ncbi:MAG TPA: glycosyltransferase family 4 protein [Tepidisphaeraceae bacterium]|nr:glycosyltransferase family 4 protein [Tepidisphaeraceae bacterium]
MPHGPHGSSGAPVQTVALLGSYVPRQCGIATFTKDLRDSIADAIGQRETTVLAMDDIAGGYHYPPEVRLQIPQQKQGEYVTAADLLNINQIDLVLVQHEYGIFGGRDGGHVLDLIRNLRMPAIATLHTVLSEPSTGQRAVMKELARHCDRLVVMSHFAEKILQETYSITPQKIAFIPHGIPDVPFVEPTVFRDQFGLEGRRVLFTFGLLGPGKGIEVALKAMPAIVKAHPDVIYVVLGATHPHVLRSEGNAYRNSLERMVEQLGLRDHVMFHNRYVTMDELIRYISLADIYITPYPNKQQITSGTMAYALGAGKAVVSTPHWYAEEMLAEGRGRLFPFGDSAALATTVIDLLNDEQQRTIMRKRAYAHGRPMIWKEVARSYLNLAQESLRERQRGRRGLPAARFEAVEVLATPDLNLAHLRRMTDDTGILQHAVYAVPDRHHGYCADDNARALIAAMMCHDVTGDPAVLDLADNYLAFLHFAFDHGRKRFRNFLSYDRRWLEEQGSEDCHGRCVWALGTIIQLSVGEGATALSTRLIHDAMEHLEQFTSPRAWAFALIGVDRYLNRFAGDTKARRVRGEVAQRLFERFSGNMTPEWPWCEDVVTYDNAKLPHALILSGHQMANEAMLNCGLRALEWLVALQITDAGRISLIGNNGWLTRSGVRARFDQQPIEAMAMVEACADAFRVTGDEAWSDRARQFVDWFLGSNDSQTVIYDPQTGGCRDGLLSAGPNLNQGAESTLAWLISLLTLMDLNRSRTADPDSPPAKASVMSERPLTAVVG